MDVTSPAETRRTSTTDDPQAAEQERLRKVRELVDQGFPEKSVEPHYRGDGCGLPHEWHPGE